MAVLLAATATLLGIAVAVLFSPITVDLFVAKDADVSSVDVRVRVRWMGVSLKRRHSPRTPRARRSSVRRRGPGLARIRALLLSPGFASRTRRLITELAALGRPRLLKVNVRVGFEDPSDTGALLGWLHAGAVGGGCCRVHIQPDFTAAVLAGSARLRWRRNAASLLWPVLTFAASPVVWRAARRYLAERQGVPEVART